MSLKWYNVSTAVKVKIPEDIKQLQILPLIVDYNITVIILQEKFNDLASLLEKYLNINNILYIKNKRTELFRQNK